MQSTQNELQTHSVHTVKHAINITNIQTINNMQAISVFTKSPHSNDEDTMDSLPDIPDPDHKEYTHSKSLSITRNISLHEQLTVESEYELKANPNDTNLEKMLEDSSCIGTVEDIKILQMNDNKGSIISSLTDTSAVKQYKNDVQNNDNMNI